MKKITAQYEISRTAAILAGKSEFGTVVVTVDPSTLAEAQRAELASAVKRALARLPDEQREALALRESEGLTFDQIGQLLGVPTATVKSRVRYALLKLADDLRPYQDGISP